MASYLITGVAGFIASKVADLLLAEGHSILGIDNLNDAYDVRLKHWRLEQIHDHPHFRFHQSDILDRRRLHEVFELAAESGRPGFDAVFNLAARAGVQPSVQDPWAYYETNVTGTLNLLDLCREYGIARFVLASTSSLYGAHNSCPFREDADTNRPLSPYAASKKAAEALCHTYHHLYGINVAIPRYFTVYGPAGRPDMSLFRFVQWISEGRSVVVFGDGTQSRDFTFVEDIARGTIACLGVSGYHTVNLGSDQPVVLMDAIRLIERLVDKPAAIDFRPSHPADVHATWADIDRARLLLDWQPRTSFEQGVSALVSWYQEHREWARYVRT
jgi:nucleoside-diphosphate-sugar epimerase